MRPEVGRVKLNMDGSISGECSCVGMGGLLRNSSWGWIKALRLANSAVAELWALRGGLRVAHDWDVQSIIIELYTKIRVDLLLG